MSKTRKEIDALKRDWSRDPNWDIEETDGFEDHYHELLEHRLEMESQWRREKEASHEAKAERLGCPGNVQLARYIEALENRISALEARLDAAA